MTALPVPPGRLLIRPAEPDDAVSIFTLVSEFAAFEGLSHLVDATQEGLGEALFGASPRVFCEIADWVDGDACIVQLAGCAIWFYNFSTFRGRHGLYLEDLFVRPAFRRRKIGTAMLAHLARRCVREGLPRFDWTVLGWNRAAIDFYAEHGAEFLDQLRLCRVSGEALARLASA